MKYKISIAQKYVANTVDLIGSKNINNKNEYIEDILVSKSDDDICELEVNIQNFDSDSEFFESLFTEKQWSVIGR